ncbi:bifunctional UDP-N-acetylglucosamine diphosphorylase/glucosamine-1-phosphate N-acetyltransferase GlmU, partial [Streptomyces sp. P17]|nr:bifunctional UDP-N-acetylglucosamine diphosphorylase/glucosamine-1-phosphate N-acetyltransferase GlmU [Streptomyces sp. P17]
KDADAATRAIALCNSGVMAVDAALLRDLVGRLGNDNASGEYYLTDVVGLARAQGRSAAVVTCDEAETIGINTRAELAQAEAAFQAR